jgi:uncharacterized membrane protein HdeD (DUF308 family)
VVEAAAGPTAATWGSVARAWWLFLITGILWLCLSVIVFRADLTTVYAISIMFGVIAIVAGVNEFISLGAVRGGWRWLNAILGVIFVAAGIVALSNPEWTFLALASIIGFWFLFKGIFDLILAFATKHVNDLWWVQMVVGFIEIGLAFWVAGDFAEKQVLLVVYVGLVCLSKGITEIILAFRLHGVKQELRAA